MTLKCKCKCKQHMESHALSCETIRGPPTYTLYTLSPLE